jgi:hypothetical protein
MAFRKDILISKMSGAIGGNLPASELANHPDAAAADAFIRIVAPELAQAPLDFFTIQIVQGSLFRFTYGGHPGEV